MEPSIRRSITGLFSRSGPDRSSDLSRVESNTSAISNLSISEDEKGRLGLTTLHRPGGPTTTAVVADIIFIHGLGGGSRKTWSFSKDPDHYWPQAWLLTDPDFEDVRIHVFGYKADWTERQQSSLNIRTFGERLLGDLKNDPSIRRDTTSIILVGHSMGGCVAKVAYNLVRQDPTCKDLADRMHSIFFLGTPHRGADLAVVLENMITLAWGRKPFVNDLTPGSNALAEINGTFRHFALDLRLWSFYETLPVKTINKVIVGRNSATLEYPNEEMAAMDADHRHVCKFESRADPNYRILRNALHTATDMIRASRRTDGERALPRRNMYHANAAAAAAAAGGQSSEDDSIPAAELGSRLIAFLGNINTMEDDLTTLQVLKEPGSCEWLTSRHYFNVWERGEGAQVLWLTGRPSAGKSVLSSHVVDRVDLSAGSTYCSYFFFKFGKRGKSTWSDCFLSLAYQMAMQDIHVRDCLHRLQHEKTAWDKSDESSLWRRLFAGAVFACPSITQHVWVIDGVDECDNFNALFTKKLLATIPAGLRVFATSRDLEEIGRGLSTLGARAELHPLSDDDTLDDMRLFLAGKLKELDRLKSDERREAMCDKILLKSCGSFLWVRLVLQDFENAWTEEAMDEVLRDVPAGLNAVYHRILLSVESNPKKKRLARAILNWVVLASRPLSTEELRCALKFDIDENLQNMVKGIPSLCGQLVFVDQAGKVQLIHDTARHFLLNTGLESELAVSETPSHSRISALLLRYLLGDVLKPQQTKMAQLTRPKGFSKSAKAAPPDTSLLAYAASFFSDHMDKCEPKDVSLMPHLCSFLQSHNVLSWIEHIAHSGDLSDITRTATNLRRFIGRRIKHLDAADPRVHFVDEWVIDLIRVAAKFRPQLLTCPSSIHCLVPPLCPPASVISRTFAQEARLAPLVVKNLPPGTWDDCLIRIDFQKGQTTSVAHGDAFFAVGLSTGRLCLYDRDSVQRIWDASHPERIRLMAFSQDDRYIVTCGAKHVVVWITASGTTRLSSSILRAPPLAVTFLGCDELLLATQSSELTKWNLETEEHETISWRESVDEDYDMVPVAIPDQPPSRAAFSTDAPGYELLLAVGYRSHPVYVWNALELQLLGTCGTGLNGVDDMVFNPNPELAALAVSFTDGSLCLFDHETLEIHSTRPGVHAYSLSCSPDGRSLVAGSSRGVIHVFEFDQARDGSKILTPIYHVDTLDDAIRGVSFGADGLRFVDVGRRQCRVWEPAALVRKDTEVDSMGEALQLPLKVSSVLELPEQPDITSPLVASDEGGFVVTGKADGSVAIFSAASGLEMGVIYSHIRGASVVVVALASHGRLVVSADDSGRVLAAELDSFVAGGGTAKPGVQGGDPSQPASQVPAARILLDRKFGMAVSHILINPKADRILVGGRDKDELWELPSGALIKSRRLGRNAVQATTYDTEPGSTSPRGSFVRSSTTTTTTMASAAVARHSAFQHPGIPTYFISISGDKADVFNWHDFTDVSPPEGIHLRRPAVLSESLNSPAVKASYHVVQPNLVIEHIAASAAEPTRILLWPARAFDAASELAGIPLKDPSVEAVSPSISGVLGVVGSTKLLFVDVNYWICSLDLRHPSIVSSVAPRAGTLTRSGTLPRSWDPNQPAPAKRHFFALSEWRDGNNDFSCSMVSPPASTFPRNQHSQTFVFASSSRVLVVKGGLEFGETVAVGFTAGDWLVFGRKALQGEEKQTGVVLQGKSSTGHQTWTVVSGSMHRRASHG